MYVYVFYVVHMLKNFFLSIHIYISFDFILFYTLKKNSGLLRKVYSWYMRILENTAEIFRWYGRRIKLIGRIECFYNPPNNFSRRAHVDRSSIFWGFFVFLGTGLSIAFLLIRHWPLQNVFLGFPRPIKSLAWTFAYCLVFLPSK